MSLTDKTKHRLNENCNISLKGKNVLVTGANSGVGFKTAEISAYLGADVILACCNMERAEAARLKLISEYPEDSECHLGWRETNKFRFNDELA